MLFRSDSKGKVTKWERENSSSSASAAAGADASNNVASADTNHPRANADAAFRNAPAQPAVAAGSRTGQRDSRPQADHSQDSAALSAQASQSSPVNTRPVGTSGIGNAQANDTQARARELPRTASRAPMIGVIGLLALAAAVGMRRVAAFRR